MPSGVRSSTVSSSQPSSTSKAVCGFWTAQLAPTRNTFSPLAAACTDRRAHSIFLPTSKPVSPTQPASKNRRPKRTLQLPLTPDLAAYKDGPPHLRMSSTSDFLSQTISNKTPKIQGPFNIWVALQPRGSIPNRT